MGFGDTFRIARGILQRYNFEFSYRESCGSIMWFNRVWKIYTGTSILVRKSTTDQNKSKEKDGTTTTTTTTTSDDNNDTDDDDTDDDNNDEVIDSLDLVKRAYQRQEQHQRRRQIATKITRNQILIDEEKKMKHSAIRSGLPAASYKDIILNSVTENRVVVLCGSTG